MTDCIARPSPAMVLITLDNKLLPPSGKYFKWLLRINVKTWKISVTRTIWLSVQKWFRKLISNIYHYIYTKRSKNTFPRYRMWCQKIQQGILWIIFCIFNHSIHISDDNTGFRNIIYTPVAFILHRRYLPGDIKTDRFNRLVLYQYSTDVYCSGNTT